MSGIVKIGHRGAAGHAPENTLRSFARAIELGVDMIELDVHRCGSGELVVCHDDDLSRTTNGTGFISETDLSVIRTLDAGEGERVPLLTEALGLIDRRVQVNIELKGNTAAKPVAELINGYIAAGWGIDRFLVSSFNHLELWEIKSIIPALRTGALAAAVPPGFVPFAKEMQAYSLNIHYPGATRQLVEETHAAEMKLFVYTVDEPADIEAMKKLGVDGIFSDFPDRL